MKRYVIVIAALTLGGSLMSCGNSEDSATDRVEVEAESSGFGGDMEAFCELAATSSQSRDEAQVDSYYDELGEVAPGELATDIATLRSGWQSISMSLDALGGEAEDVSRPPEVSAAARNVMDTMLDECGIDGGVYLVLPEAGL